MRIAFRIAFLVVVGGAFIVETSCGDDTPANDSGDVVDAGSPAIVGDASSPERGDAEAPMATMRLAHLAPEQGPVDFCYQAAHNGIFVGPVFGATMSQTPTTVDAAPGADASAVPSPSDAGDGGDAEAMRPSALYGTVSKYLSLSAAGPLTIAIVGGGAASCGSPIAKGTVTLDPGKLSTLALFGRVVDGGTELDMAAFTDDRTTVADEARVRVIHAALGNAEVAGSGALAVRAVAAKTTVLANRVEPRRASSASEVISVDALGYVTAAPIPTPTALAIGPAETDGGAEAGFDPWKSTPVDLDLHGGSLHTAFVLTGTGESRFEVLWCADTTTSGAETACRLVP